MWFIINCLSPRWGLRWCSKGNEFHCVRYTIKWYVVHLECIKTSEETPRLTEEYIDNAKVWSQGLCISIQFPENWCIETMHLWAFSNHPMCVLRSELSLTCKEQNQYASKVDRKNQNSKFVLMSLTGRVIKISK